MKINRENNQVVSIQDGDQIVYRNELITVLFDNDPQYIDDYTDEELIEVANDFWIELFSDVVKD